MLSTPPASPASTHGGQDIKIPFSEPRAELRPQPRKLSKETERKNLRINGRGFFGKVLF